MDYQETVGWMFNQLPMYQQQGASAYRKDLTNTLLLSEYLDHPHKNLKLIHVAGTNGKGSTSHMIASILQEAGYKTGLYTSPHLKDFRERIKIDGKEIPENFVTDFINAHKKFFEIHNLSFFEMSVGLAFEYFKTENIDVAVIETGLGGRLDSTNIITPILSVITNIGMDHTQILGNTLELIAGEKAGIIKRDIPVVIGEFTTETKQVFSEKARAMHSDIYFASDLITADFDSDLKGDYQKSNRKTVLQSVEILKQKGFTISEQNIRAGLSNVGRNTGLMGRWQQLREHPTVICDTAHNSHGLQSVIAQIQSTSYDKLHVVLGLVNDKNLDEILPLFPKNAVYYFCRPDIPRGLDIEILQDYAGKYNLEGKSYASVSKAYAAAVEQAAMNDFIYVGGSTFVVAEIL
jgi:dihydrofolate synthase/folylpolyglutamate synthase